MGDFQANFLRPDTGINTVEGNVAGSRAAGLSKKRAAEQVRRYMAQLDTISLSLMIWFDVDCNYPYPANNINDIFIANIRRT